MNVQNLRDLWCEVLQVRSVELHHDFFDLGGDSLKAIRLAGRVEQEHGVTVAVSKIFDHSTFGQFCTLLGCAANAEPRVELPRSPRESRTSARPPAFSLFFFSAAADSYDRFGGLYSNPAVLGAALAATTQPFDPRRQCGAAAARSATRG